MLTMLDEAILDFQISIITIIGTIIFVIVCRKRRDLLKYLPAYICLSIGSIFIYLQIVDYSLRLIGNIFYFIASLLFLVGLYYEYYKIFIKKRKNVISCFKFNFILMCKTKYYSKYIACRFTKYNLIIFDFVKNKSFFK